MMHLKSLLFIALFVLNAGVESRANSYADSRDQAQELLNRLSSIPTSEQRMLQFSRLMQGLPYGMNGPLGEGETGKYDQDPLYRFDTYDCATFVETAVSLAHSTSVNDFETRMNAIRYENGVVDYLKRNHFPSLQWIPNNLLNGFFVEVNDNILPPSEQKMAEAVIDLGNWLLKAKLPVIQLPRASLDEKESALRELQSHAGDFSPVVARLPYLPISTLLANPSLLKKIPSGSVISFVRPNWDLTQSIGTHMNVSHQGLVFQTAQGTVLHHASVSEKRVVEMPLDSYLKSFENSPTLKGIHLLQPIDR